MKKIIGWVFLFFMKYILYRLVGQQLSKLYQRMLPQHRYIKGDTVKFSENSEEVWSVLDNFYDIYDGKFEAMYALKHNDGRYSYAPENAVSLNVDSYRNMDALIDAGLNSKASFDNILSGRSGFKINKDLK